MNLHAPTIHTPKRPPLWTPDAPLLCAPGMGMGMGVWVDDGAQPTPKTILGSGLFAWWRGDLGITLNGSNVSAAADQSGNGKHVTQATAANQPPFSAALINGKDAVGPYDNTNDQLQAASAADWKFLHDGTGCTGWIVLRRDRLETDIMLATGNTGAVVGASLWYTTTGQVNYQIGNGTASIAQAAGGTSTQNAAHIYGFSYSESDSPKVRVRIDRAEVGTANTSAAPGAGNPLGALCIGGVPTSPGTLPLGSPWIEIVFANRLATAAETLAIENYLRARYGTP